jgi:hypothetical protein
MFLHTVLIIFSDMRNVKLSVSVLEERDWLASCVSCFTQKVRSLCTCVGLRSGLISVLKGNIPSSA